MKKPKLIYPETFIAEREVDGKTEYAFAIKETFLWLESINLKPLLRWHGTKMQYHPKLTEGFSNVGTVYHDSPEPVKEAIDILREEVYSDHQKKLKTWHRKQAGEWKYKPCPMIVTGKLYLH